MRDLFRITSDDIKDLKLIDVYNRWVKEERDIRVEFDTDLVDDPMMCAMVENLNELVAWVDVQKGKADSIDLDKLWYFVEPDIVAHKNVTGDQDCPDTFYFGKDCVISYIDVSEDSADLIGSIYINITKPTPKGWKAYAEALEDIICKIDLPYSTKLLVDALVKKAKEDAGLDKTP
jgi:hypothetical protein